MIVGVIIGLAIGVLVGAIAMAIARPTRRAPVAPSPPDHHQLLATVVDASPSSTVVLDERGHVHYANPAAARLFFAGEVPTDASLVDVVQRSSEPLRRAMAAERTELLVLPHADEPEVVQVTKRVMDGPDGAPLTVLSAHPLTDDLLHEEVRAYKRLVRVLSHELNNSLAPIASLASSGQRLLETPDGAAELPPLLATIAERVEHLRGFLGHYAELARLPKPRPAELDVARLLGRVATLFPGVRLAVEVGHGWADEAQLEQLLGNLVKNALEAGSSPADVEIAAQAIEGRLELAVRDRGSGLSPEVMAAALVPFFSTKPGGTGLGLAICREIVENHGGRLRLRNRVGGGAEALVRLPARDRPLAATVSWALTRP